MFASTHTCLDTTSATAHVCVFELKSPLIASTSVLRRWANRWKRWCGSGRSSGGKAPRRFRRRRGSASRTASSQRKRGSTRYTSRLELGDLLQFLAGTYHSVWSPPTTPFLLLSNKITSVFNRPHPLIRSMSVGSPLTAVPGFCDAF